MLETAVIDKGIKNLYEGMHNILVVLDESFRIVNINPRFAEITHYKKEETLGRNWMEFFIPESKRDTVKQTLEAVMKHDYIMNSESFVLTKQGKAILVQWDTAPLVDAKGKCVGVVSIGVDISGRYEIEGLLKTSNESSLLQVKESAYELSEQEARLSAAIDSVPHGFVVTDRTGNVIFVNDKLNGIFATNPRQWTIEVLHECLGEKVHLISKLEACLKNKDSITIKDIEVNNKILQLYIAPVFIGQISNVIIGAIVLISDVTEEKVLERSKDEFFSIASHELRTPITAIRGNIDLIRHYYPDKIPNKDFIQMLDDISESSTRLIELVNEFLNTSRLEQGKIKFEVAPFDICFLSELVITELKNVADAKHLKLKYTQKHKNIPQAMGDKDRVKEVLINLISNAINYTDHGGVEVIVDSFDGVVCVFVKDTGKGIPEKDQKFLFRKFQQANVNLYTRDASRSSGLGLYISKLIVEGLGGKIYLEHSEQGKGSTFAFTLPIE